MALHDLRRATLVLIGAEARRHREREQTAALLRQCSPAAALDYWSWNRVTALAVLRAQELGVEHATWNAARQQAARHATDAARTTELGAMVLTRLLHDAEIDVLCLKGPLLARALYGDPAHRAASGDIDLLVAKRDFSRASAIIASQGWRPQEEPLTHGSLPERHQRLEPAGSGPRVELHWRTQLYDETLHTDGLLRRGIRDRSDGGLPLLTPSLPDALAMLLLDWLRDGIHRLRQPADIATLLDLGGAGVLDEAIGGLPPVLHGPAQQAASVLLPMLGFPAASADHRANALLTRLAACDRALGDPQRRARIAVAVLASSPAGTRRARLRSLYEHAARKVIEAPAATVAPAPVLRTASAARLAARAGLELAHAFATTPRATPTEAR
ncbi:MAG: nucleotidyltransferase family protein [Patulibacter sp.]